MFQTDNSGNKISGRETRDSKQDNGVEPEHRERQKETRNKNRSKIEGDQSRN